MENVRYVQGDGEIQHGRRLRVDFVAPCQAAQVPAVNQEQAEGNAEPPHAEPPPDDIAQAAPEENIPYVDDRPQPEPDNEQDVIERTLISSLVIILIGFLGYLLSTVVVCMFGATQPPAKNIDFWEILVHFGNQLLMLLGFVAFLLSVLYVISNKNVDNGNNGTQNDRKRHDSVLSRKDKCLLIFCCVVSLCLVYTFRSMNNRMVYNTIFRL